MTRIRPHWWQLGLLGLLLASAWGLVPHTVESDVQGYARIAIVFVGYGLLLIWFRMNITAIESEQEIYRDSELHHQNLPITERQARYRLAVLHREIETRPRKPSAHRPT